MAVQGGPVLAENYEVSLTRKGSNVYKKESRVSLVNPSGGSCRRTDSLLGDDLVLPRFAPLRAARRHDVRPPGAVGLRASLRRMA
jgi:hypothetical protein